MLKVFRRTYGWPSLMILPVGFMVSPAALAQSDTTVRERQPAEITEIITSTRKVESLYRTAASVNALNADRMSETGIDSIEDIQYLVPNLSVGDQFGVSRIFIRGIGLTSIDLGADGAVAVLLDSAAIARPAAQMTGFFDVERVEVLRGPQGTLYGRGATAGAINIISKKPTDDFEGYANLTYGNYDHYGIEAAMGGPLIGDVVLGRVAVKYANRDGYGKNLFTGNDIDDQDRLSLRASLTLRPSSTLTVDLVGDYHREDDNNYAFHFFGATTQDPLLAQVLGGKTIFDVYDDPDFHDLYSNEDPLNDREGYGFTGTINWDKDRWNFKSISSFRDFDRVNVADLDVTDISAFGKIIYTEDSTTFSQDFLLSYTEAKYDVLVGATYFNERLDGTVQVPLTNIDLIFPTVPPGSNFLQEGRIDIDAFGAFIQGTYELLPNLRATAGVRYSYEKRKGVGSFSFVDTVAGTGDPFTIPTDKSESWNAVTPKFVLDYTFANDMLLYGSVSRGFKSGVINIGSLNPVIDPEFVWAYEIGTKGTALNNFLRYSAAAFYYDYSNLQVGRVNEQSTITTENAASAENFGFELQTDFQLTPRFLVETSFTWLDATFTSFDTFEPNRPGLGEQNLSGNHLPNAPKFTFMVGAAYNQPIDNFGTITVSGDVNWTDDLFFSEFNNSDAFQNAYALINAGLRFESENNRWGFDVFARNLANKEAIANNIVAAPLFSFARVGSTIAPRTYGATLRLNF